MAHPKVAGIILAAGQGRRFGADKLLAPLAGQPLISWALQAALASELDLLVLVTRREVAQALGRGGPRLRVVLNPAPEQGQAASLKLGLSCLEPEFSHILFLLADQPLISAGLINRFLRLAQEGVELAALQPQSRLRPPALFGRRYFAELAALQGDQGGRSILERHAEMVRALKPEWAGQGADVDRPGDLAALEQRLTSPAGLSACLGLGPAELISLVGAGGKTTLMEALAAVLAQAGARVLCATTTRIYRPAGRLLLAAEQGRLQEAVRAALTPGASLTIGAGLEEAEERQKVKGLAPEALDELCATGLADYLLVEADGAKGRPLKAPREHEPVLPSWSTVVIGVLGLGGLGRPADEQNVFALTRFCALTGARPGQKVAPAHLAALIRHPRGLFKAAPAAARRLVLLNQADLPGASEGAQEVARLLAEEPGERRLLLASLRQGRCRLLG
ncbi:MAG: putative selenium-dependent hydroxylase accessory protein YqeC [Desulfarculus sp.]|nr:MAG: putative selenium-dependent hydroxylase accessory protein YqeC [Desulfarculus sp.]